ncbi:hypothetical protein [Pseudomonas sp. Nvir]|nr:hypothetical protein [Pseudomonas sp. Nvir]
MKAFIAKNQSVAIAKMNGITIYANALGTIHGQPINGQTSVTSNIND